MSESGDEAGDETRYRVECPTCDPRGDTEGDTWRDGIWHPRESFARIARDRHNRTRHGGQEHAEVSEETPA